MKKIMLSAGCCLGAFWISFWARSLDTVLGCLCFALGVLLFVASWISVIKVTKKEKEEK